MRRITVLVRYEMGAKTKAQLMTINPRIGGCKANTH